MIPEFSFVLGGPDDPAGEIEKTFEFIRRIKAVHPECEVDPLLLQPDAAARAGLRADARRRRPPAGAAHATARRVPSCPRPPRNGPQPRWIDYVCHQDAPWLDARLRRRVSDFATVLGCRFPTVQDHHTPAWGKSLLRGSGELAAKTARYDDPWELRLARRMIPVREPQRDSV